MAEPASQPTELVDAATGTTPAGDAAPVADPGTVNEDAPLALEQPAQKRRAVATARAVASGDPPTGDLLDELARAMHAAATAQYERLNAELERRRSAQVDVIAGRAATDIEHLKAATESDIEAIDAWAKAETEKISLERVRRIEVRRADLEAQLDRQETIRQREVFAIEAAIDAHRTEIDRFFGRMEREHDPAAIAQVAATMPALPPLDRIADEAREAASKEFAAGDAPPLAAATAEPATEPATETATQKATEAAGADDEPGNDLAVSESRLMAVMDPEATSSPREGDPSRDWAQPMAVSVAAGATDAASDTGSAEADGGSKVGSTLLRTVRAIRPLGDHKDRD